MFPHFIEVAVAVSDCKTDVADGGTQWKFLGQIVNSEAVVGIQWSHTPLLGTAFFYGLFMVSYF